MNNTEFKKAILEGIPEVLPPLKPYDPNINHAPRRKDILTNDEKKLAFKISIASFLILISILISIIGTSYIYEYREINRELRTESNMIDMNPGIREVIKNENLPIFR